MAKGKGGRVASAGPKKKHGPKKKMFHCWSSTMRKHLADAGLLDKCYNFESFALACNARGKRNVSRSDFNTFIGLSREEKEKYFADIKK